MNTDLIALLGEEGYAHIVEIGRARMRDDMACDHCGGHDGYEEMLAGEPEMAELAAVAAGIAVEIGRADHDDLAILTVALSAVSQMIGQEFTAVTGFVIPNPN